MILKSSIYFCYVRLQIIRRTRSDKTASEELLTGEDPAKNHTTGVENRREYTTPHSAALRQTASVRRQASLYQHCSSCTRDLWYYWLRQLDACPTYRSILGEIMSYTENNGTACRYRRLATVRWVTRQNNILDGSYDFSASSRIDIDYS